MNKKQLSSWKLFQGPSLQQIVWLLYQIRLIYFSFTVQAQEFHLFTLSFFFQVRKFYPVQSIKFAKCTTCKYWHKSIEFSIRSCQVDLWSVNFGVSKVTEAFSKNLPLTAKRFVHKERQFSIDQHHLWAFFDILYI